MPKAFTRRPPRVLAGPTYNRQSLALQEVISRARPDVRGLVTFFTNSSSIYCFFRPIVNGCYFYHIRPSLQNGVCFDAPNAASDLTPCRGPLTGVPEHRPDSLAGFQRLAPARRIARSNLGREEL
jgi:hypothetical protein